MYKIAIATVALAFLAAPAFTGTAKATPLVTGAHGALVAGPKSAAPASDVVPVWSYNRYGYRPHGHYGGSYGHRSFGHRGGFYGHRSYGFGRYYRGNRSYRGGHSSYRGRGYGGGRSYGYGRGGYRGGRGRY